MAGKGAPVPPPSPRASNVGCSLLLDPPRRPEGITAPSPDPGGTAWVGVTPQERQRTVGAGRGQWAPGGHSLTLASTAGAAAQGALLGAPGLADRGLIGASSNPWFPRLETGLHVLRDVGIWAEPTPSDRFLKGVCDRDTFTRKLCRFQKLPDEMSSASLVAQSPWSDSFPLCC